MLAVSAVSQSRTAPLDGLAVHDVPEPAPPQGWVRVHVKAAGLNHHDLWSLMGVGLPADRLPMILGCDAAGITDDGQKVIVHAVVASPGWVGDETLDPKRTLLSELHPGTLAEYVCVPQSNVVPLPHGMSWETAGVLSTAWLTAYRMLFSNAGVRPGDTVLVQGVGGGVASALIQLGHAAGLRVWATSRDEGKRDKALQFGADEVFASGERLPERVDAVLDTVGAAVWRHSIKSLRSGGTLVTAGATSGDPGPMEITDIFFRQLRIIGSTMGSRAELVGLTRFVAARGIEPLIDRVLPLADARVGFERLQAEDLLGKVVLVDG